MTYRALLLFACVVFSMPSAAQELKTVRGMIGTGTLDSAVGDYAFLTRSTVGDAIFAVCKMGDECVVEGLIRGSQILAVASVRLAQDDENKLEVERVGRWDHSKVEEDLGPFCVAQYRNDNGDRIGFHGSQAGYIAAFVEFSTSDLPDSIAAVWEIDGRKTYGLRGEINDYFGYPEMPVTDADIFDDIARGSSLTISMNGVADLAVGLDGSSEALNEFARCLRP